MPVKAERYLGYLRSSVVEESSREITPGLVSALGSASLRLGGAGAGAGTGAGAGANAGANAAAAAAMCGTTAGGTTAGGSAVGGSAVRGSVVGGASVGGAAESEEATLRAKSSAS
jgi:hypothetical protein